MKRAFALLLPVFVGCSTPPPRTLLVRAGRLIDGTGAQAREHVRVLIQDGVIVSIDADDGARAPAGASVVDATTSSVLPGLVDAHAHLFAGRLCHPEHEASFAEPARTSHALLGRGVTTVADFGTPAPVAVALRQHIGTARNRGPRLLVAGPILTASGRPPADPLGREAAAAGAAREVANPADAVLSVRALAVTGVDFVAVTLDEHGPTGAVVPTFDRDTWCAVVKEAKRQKLRVLTQATSDAAIALARSCGVDALVPGLVEPLGLGIDACADLGGSPLRELERLRATGLSALEVLRVSTSGSARVLDLQDALGTLAPGYRADLIGVDGRPDEKLEDIARVRLVILDGVVQELDDPGIGEELELGWRLLWSWLLG